MDDWMAGLAGRFIVFDGPDGSGKSTQFARFAERAGRHVEVCEVREPGGTHVGEAIRDVLLDPAQDGMCLRCEMLLYMASRAQLLHELIRPALARNALVLADRFISSTLAYQGTAGGLERSDILAVGRIAIGRTWPDLTVIFDVDEATASTRVQPDRDRMEQKSVAYRARVREGYLEQASEEPGSYLVIDACAAADDVTTALMHGVESHTLLARH